ncbi:Hemolysin, chromosomal [Roseovarius sp. THAF8]|uniref:calcium-binding protein n=1 Tax=Roseovarius sp. THAF8 TaxID=2587846 RepID=UPI001267C01B|nr:calcium-binding protein [Roseovarius sp. THAF8]QFT97614.1 Hemolysin, chromosomal [Roseovarius sp. THAF8]
MLFLAGLIGMVAVGTAAMWGFEDLGTSNARDDIGTPGDPSDEASDYDNGAAAYSGAQDSLLDIATDDDPEGDDYGIARGTADADTLSGGEASEFLEGLDGDDLIASGDGDDVARGGDGDDTINGEAGDDTLHGEAGNDTLAGGAGSDSVMGHDGDDHLSGGAGDDSLVGGEGADTLMGDTGDDALHGYLGNDSLDGGAGADTLFGGDGNDVLTGVAPDATAPEQDQDYLNGGSGDDEITLGAGDIATGGTGADSFILRDWLDADHQGQIVDFNTAEDNLVLLYDYDGTVPDVTIEEDPDAQNLHRVLLGGEVIANVTSDAALTLAHITLIPQTTG